MAGVICFRWTNALLRGETMNRILLGFLCLAMSLPAVSVAQGSASLDSAMQIHGSGDSPFTVVRSVEGKIAEIKADHHVIVIEDKRGKRFEFRIDDKTKFKADRRTEL